MELAGSKPAVVPGGAYDLMFGRRTGRHSHPDTHPAWMTFTAQDCPRCGKAGA